MSFLPVQGRADKSNKIVPSATVGACCGINVLGEPVGPPAKKRILQACVHAYFIEGHGKIDRFGGRHFRRRRSITALH